ncbi:MAG: histidine phosphatase family protein [Granulosicoccus sp.]
MHETLQAQLPQSTHETRFWWVRHARVPEIDHRMYGSLDVDSDVTDLPLFKGVAARLPKDAHWITSPLKRTKQTADALIAAGASAASWEEDADIIEMNFGAYNGMSLQALYALRDDPYLGFWPMSPHHNAPDGESFSLLVDRVARFVTRMQNERMGQDVVCVAHRGTILAALHIALKLPLDTSVSFDIDNVSLTRLIHHADVPKGGPKYRVRDVGWVP